MVSFVVKLLSDLGERVTGPSQRKLVLAAGKSGLAGYSYLVGKTDLCMYTMISIACVAVRPRNTYDGVECKVNEGNSGHSDKITLIKSL